MDITTIIQSIIALSIMGFLIIKMWQQSKAIFLLVLGGFFAPGLIFMAGFATDSGTKEAILTGTIMVYTGIALIPICLIALFTLMFKQLGKPFH